MTDQQTNTGLKRFLDQAAGHRLLTAPEELALGRRVQAGDTRAREQLVLANIRLVVSIARYYRNRGMDMEDVIQEGVIGLNRAAEKFDPKRGIRFSTYATLWIKQSIQRALLGRASTIRLPSAVAGNRAKLQASLMSKPGSDTAALAEEFGISESEVLRALDAAEVVTSLDRQMVTDDSAHTMLDSISDPNADIPHELTPENVGPLYAALEELEYEKTTLHRRVIELRFGLGCEPLLIKEITSTLKFKSDNSVKALQAEALAWLRERLGQDMGRL